MVEISGLAHVVVEASDPEAWRALGENVIGMMAAGTGDGLALEMDERDHRILVRRGQADRYLARRVGGCRRRRVRRGPRPVD